ncbi:LLM class flavin-dependent oxidoreductase [Brevibacterium rongguiense]|nr:LLM class flavin-dependent oxidoreductase [Brevibacterium rongguiense]
MTAPAQPMTAAPSPARPVHAPAAVRIPLAAAAEPAAQLAQLREAARRLEAAGVTWLVLGDDGQSGFDAVTVAGWLAPATESIVLVPEAPVTHAEPFHLATATATLDHDSRGRAGWAPIAQTSEAAARLVGRRPAATAGAAWAEVPVVAEAVTALWHSWEPDAIVRDAATGRFVDRERLHYVRFTGTDSVGEEFTITGPSIVPRPPQGTLPTLIRVTGPETAEAAAQAADIVVLAEAPGAAGWDAAPAEDRTVLRALHAQELDTAGAELSEVLVDVADAAGALRLAEWLGSAERGGNAPAQASGRAPAEAGGSETELQNGEPRNGEQGTPR